MGFVKAKPRRPKTAGLGDAGQFSTAASHTPRRECYVGAHSGGKGKPRRVGLTRAHGPGGSGGFLGFVPTVPSNGTPKKLEKKNPGQE